MHGSPRAPSTMVRFDTLARPFVRSIRGKAAALGALKLTQEQQARFREVISDDIRKFCDVILPHVRPPRVSLAAKARATRLGVNLALMTWQDQPRFDPGRKQFHLEHQVPVSTIREECVRRPTEAAIMRTLKAQLRVVWILKQGDRALTKLGYGTKRVDPAAAYKEAGIRLASIRRKTRPGLRRARGLAQGCQRDRGKIPVACGVRGRVPRAAGPGKPPGTRDSIPRR